MRTVTAAAGSAAFGVLAPGVVAGLVPWWLMGWTAGSSVWWPAQVAGGLLVAGQALLLSRPVLAGYAALVAVAFASFVRWYEQPVLARRYGTQYQDYLRASSTRNETSPWSPN